MHSPTAWALVFDRARPPSGMPHRLRTALPWLAALATAGAVVALLAPGSLAEPVLAHQDKLGHIALFGALAVLWRLAGVSARRVVAAAAVLAVTTESLQALMALGRHGDPVDALVDVVGATLGALLVPQRVAEAPARVAAEPTAKAS